MKDGRRAAVFGKRTWIKLWTVEWLDGTTRYQMTDAQRAFWIDLLAMAGRSRFPGIICAGKDGADFVGYPISKFLSLMAQPIDIEATLELFQRTGKVRVEVTSDGPPKLFMIELLNWKKYQSDLASQAGRSQKYRDRQKTSARTVTRASQNVTPLEEEEDGESDGNQIQSTTAEAAAPLAPATASSILQAFQSLNVKPFGPKAFQETWTERFEQIPTNEPRYFVEAMEATIVSLKERGLRVPGKFFNLKRVVEKMEVEVCLRQTPQ